VGPNHFMRGGCGLLESRFQSSVRINVGPNDELQLIEACLEVVSILRED